MPYTTYFSTIIKPDPEKYEVEKQRVKDILNRKYKEDEEFRLKRINYQRQYRQLLKQKKQNITETDMIVPL